MRLSGRYFASRNPVTFELRRSTLALTHIPPEQRLRIRIKSGDQEPMTRRSCDRNARFSCPPQLHLRERKSYIRLTCEAVVTKRFSLISRNSEFISFVGQHVSITFAASFFVLIIVARENPCRSHAR